MEKDVVIITGSMTRGGAEGVIASIAEVLARRGWQIHIVSILFRENAYSFGENIECIDASREGRNQLLDTPRMIRAIKKEIKRIRPCAVISFMAKINIVAWLAVMGTGVKYIASERNDPAVGRNAVYPKVLSMAYAAADVVVFQTTRAKDYFNSKIQRNGVIIPNPLKPMPEATYDQTKRIVTVGRLSEQKNHKLLIDAFEKIHRDYPDFSVDIYGEGSLRNELQAYIDDKKLTASVHLCGKVDNVPEMIRDACMFVLPSDYEGLSNALLEAMGIGLPCITTNCAGSDDAIRDGENGLIVPVGDEAAMEHAMRRLLEAPEQATEMGRNARRSMERYGVESVVDQWEKLLF